MERGTNEPRILTNDPSFTAWGWAILSGSGKVFKTGCIKTAPEQKKRRIRTSDDRTRRTSEIVQELIKLIKEHDIQYILSEAPHGSQNASAAIMIGIVTGVTTAIAECLNIPIEYYSEQDAKKAVLNRRTATKDEMIAAISKLYDVTWTGVSYKDEAIADALAVHYVAIQQSQTLKFMKKSYYHY